ncbi:shc transforming protein [Aphelenchoides avenae]|nr:shc transforming protein [Aphelenchus avenae]
MATAPGEVVQPECIRGVLGEGMPIPSSLEKGNLYVLFDVKFPSDHEGDKHNNFYKKLEALLPARPKADVPPKHGYVEEVTLPEFHEQRYKRAGGETIIEEHARKRFFEITKLLTHEPWFHGPISREEAESRVQTTGDFLVRQSKSHEGQIVLSAMGDGALKHVFLVDENGTIKTTDTTFMGIRELINFYMDSKRPMGDVVLTTPIRRPELRL